MVTAKYFLSLVVALFVFSHSLACVVKGPDGSFDLASISGKTFVAPVNNDAIGLNGEIRTTICALQTDLCEDELLDFPSDGICFMSGGSYIFNLGNWLEAPPEPIATPQEDDSGKYLSIIFDNNNSVAVNKFELKIRCGSGNPIGFKEQKHPEIDYIMEIYANSLDMCGGGGLSGGWLFIIILFSVVVVYAIAGMVYAVKVQKKPLGISSLPGFAAFLGVFALAKDGVLFLYSKITKKSTPSENYSSYGTIEE